MTSKGKRYGRTTWRGRRLVSCNGRDLFLSNIIDNNPASLSEMESRYSGDVRLIVSTHGLENFVNVMAIDVDERMERRRKYIRTMVDATNGFSCQHSSIHTKQ